MESENLLLRNSLKTHIEQAISVNSSRIFIQILCNFIEKYYTNNLLIQIRKSIIEVNTDATKHFWELEEKDLLDSPIHIKPESMLLPVGGLTRIFHKKNMQIPQMHDIISIINTIKKEFAYVKLYHENF